MDTADACQYYDFQGTWKTVQQRIPDGEIIKELKKITSREALEEFIQIVKGKKEHGHVHKRSKKIGSRFEKFFVGIYQFLDAYSGIAEIVKAVDQRSGGLVYGLLSVLVGAVQNKRNREDTITRTLDEITTWLQDLKDYQEIYRTSCSLELNKRIFRVYNLVVHFALDAWQYLQRSTISRLWNAISEPPKYALQPIVDDLKKAIQSVLSETVKNLHTSNQQQLLELREMHELLKIQGEQEWDNRLTDIKCLLGASGMTNLVDYSLSLKSNWNENGIHPVDLQEMEKGTKNTLYNDDSCKRWIDSDKSSFLIITGRNHPNSGYNETLWLSTAILDFAQSTRSKENRVVFYAVQPKDSASDILSVIIVEILHLDREFFKSQFSYLNECAKRNRECFSDLNWKCEIIERLLREWTRKIPTAVIYIILDRVDECLLPRAERSQRSEDLRTIAQSFLKNVRQSDFVCKFLLLSHDEYWPGWDLGLWDNDAKRQDRFHYKLCWQQSSLPLWSR